MSENVRTCEHCGATFTRRRNPGAQPEALARFERRRFCSHECSRGNLPGATIEDRFWAKVDKTSSPDGCWLWTAYISTAGYGLFSRRFGDQVYAHRWAHEEFISPIPEGWEVDHLCRVRACCNPRHLEAVTPAENNRRAMPFRAIRPKKARVIARRQSCDHAMTPENTITRRDGVRWCRTCREALYARLRAS